MFGGDIINRLIGIKNMVLLIRISYGNFLYKLEVILKDLVSDWTKHEWGTP